jgi:hypothetical protein
MQILVDDIEAIERVLTAVDDPNSDLEQVAELVEFVDPLSDRILALGQAIGRRRPHTVRDAVVMVGCSVVEREARVLVNQWLHALEQDGARIIRFRDAAEQAAAEQLEDELARRRPMAKWAANG